MAGFTPGAPSPGDAWLFAGACRTVQTLERVLRLRIGGIAFLLPLILVLSSGCTTHIVPPGVPPDPVRVCVIKTTSYHSALLLPEKTGAVEYEYGEWNWFALERNSCIRILPTLFFPTQGTLARKHVNFAPDQAQDKASAKRVLCFTVSAQRAERLRQELDAQFQAGAATEIYNPDYGLFFVQVPQAYHAFHNCNNELASWLRELGCDVKGPATFGAFRLDPRVSNQVR